MVDPSTNRSPPFLIQISFKAHQNDRHDFMALKLEGLSQRVFFAGGYGSGKTEVAVNVARELRRQSDDPVHLIDLDVVNPYFRSREALAPLAKEGIHVVAPKGDSFFSDLPIVLPEVRSLLAKPKGTVIVDAGGSDVGAIVLSSLHDLLPAGSYELWMVLNTCRPFTESVDGCLKMIWEIEQSSGLQATGIVSNSNLLSFTTKETVMDGIEIARRVADHLKLPLKFASMPETLKSKLTERESGCPLLPLHLSMLRPWEKSAHV